MAIRESQQLALRDRVMRRRSLLLTPQERLARAEALRQQCMAILMSSPAGWEHFRRRNLRKRAVRVQHDQSIPA